MNALVQCGGGNEELPAQVGELSALDPVTDSLVDLPSSEIEWMVRGLKCYHDEPHCRKLECRTKQHVSKFMAVRDYHDPAPGVCEGWNMRSVSLNICSTKQSANGCRLIKR